MPWWDWAEWEHFIDWMALNGVNLTLSITGQESVWYKVWTEMGMTDEQVRSYFTGPAHLPWHRMTNIDHWGGPLPKSWLDDQEMLQKKIVERERSLGIRTALPAFNGHVPEYLCDIYPDAPISHIKPWAGYTEKESPWFLDPMSDLYGEIQKKFIDMQTRMYGTDHIYGLDIFNEIAPPSTEPEYLGRVSRQIYESIAAVDKDAVWLQMGWLFYNDRDRWTPDRVEAYLTSFPAENQLMMDYYAEQIEVWRLHNNFHNVPFLWCYLGNFGGNSHMSNTLDRVNERLEAALAETVVDGIGCTLEGFDCTPYAHEYTLEKAWDFETHKDLDKWFSHLSVLRGGCDDPALQQAWDIVKHDINTRHEASQMYVCGRFVGGLDGRPRTDCHHSYKFTDADEATLRNVVSLMLSSKGKGDTFDYDLVNFTRQWMTARFWQMERDYKAAAAEGDTAAMKSHAVSIISLMEDMDHLLGCREEFLMGKWISDARAKGNTPEEKDYYEQNARNLLSSWSMENNDPHLNDYACREWNGLIKDLYIPRWKAFFEAQTAGNFDQKPFWDNVLTPIERDFWQTNRSTYPAKARGQARRMCATVFNKYQTNNL